MKNDINLEDYTLLEGSKDVTATRIEKSNIKYDFTIADMLAEQEELKKYIKQFEGQDMVEAARMVNVVKNHPQVSKMESVERVAAKIYQDSSDLRKKLVPKIKEFKEQLEQSKKELAFILKNFNLKLPTKKEVVEVAVSKIVDNGE